MSIETIREALETLYERAWNAALCGDIDNKQCAIDTALSTIDPDAIRAKKMLRLLDCAPRWLG